MVVARMTGPSRYDSSAWRRTVARRAAVRSSVPTRVVSELPEGTELPQEIERNAYFIASEALMNAATMVSARSFVAASGNFRW